MNLLSMTAFILLLILFVGGYLLLTDEVSGPIKLGLIVFLVMVGIYFLMNLSFFKSYYEVIDIPIDASASYIYNSNKFKQVDQVYSLSTWIYIEDWNTNFGVKKNILDFERKGAKSTRFELDQYENNLLIHYDVYKSSSNTAEVVTQMITIPNINIQKWVNITVSFNTNNTDTYINGKLIDTDIHPYPIYSPTSKKTNTGDLILAKETGFSGKIGLTRYYGRVLSPQDALNIYHGGPTTNLLGTLLNRYNASFTFYQDNEEVQKIFIM
jgi:hypothetical protein